MASPSQARVLAQVRGEIRDTMRNPSAWYSSATMSVLPSAQVVDQILRQEFQAAPRSTPGLPETLTVLTLNLAAAGLVDIVGSLYAQIGPEQACANITTALEEARHTWMPEAEPPPATNPEALAAADRRLARKLWKHLPNFARRPPPKGTYAALRQVVSWARWPLVQQMSYLAELVGQLTDATVAPTQPAPPVIPPLVRQVLARFFAEWMLDRAVSEQGISPTYALIIDGVEALATQGHRETRLLTGLLQRWHEQYSFLFWLNTPHEEKLDAIFALFDLYDFWDTFRDRVFGTHNRCTPDSDVALIEDIVRMDLQRRYAPI